MGDSYSSGRYQDAREIARLRARVAELEATIARLTARGIEDMQHRIDELEGVVEELVRRGWVRIPYRMNDVGYSREARSVDELIAALDAAREK